MTSSQSQLNNIVVAAVTSTIRAILAAVPKSVLTRKLGQLSVGGRQKICAALDAMANC